MCWPGLAEWVIPCEWLICIHNNNSGGKEKRRIGNDRMSFDSNLLGQQQVCVGNLSEHLRYTPTHPCLHPQWATTIGINISGLVSIVPACVRVDFVPSVSTATCSPPTPHHSDSLLKGLQTELWGGGASCLLCQWAGLVPPSQHWHSTWGGLTSCLSLCPHFYFAALPPSTDPRVNKVTFHLFFHVSLLSLFLPLAAIFWIL